MSTYIGLTEVRRSEVLEKIGKAQGITKEVGEAYGNFARRVNQSFDSQEEATKAAYDANVNWMQRERKPGEIGPTRGHVVRNEAVPEKVFTGKEDTNDDVPKDELQESSSQPAPEENPDHLESGLGFESLVQDSVDEPSPVESGSETVEESKNGNESEKGSTFLDSMTK